MKYLYYRGEVIQGRINYEIKYFLKNNFENFQELKIYELKFFKNLFKKSNPCNFFLKFYTKKLYLKNYQFKIN